MGTTPTDTQDPLHADVYAAPCKVCGYPETLIDGYCDDCWSGYNLCKARNDYRCEHLIPDDTDLLDPEYRSCHCGHEGCRTGFVEGSEHRIVTRDEFAALVKEWERERNPADPRPGRSGR